MTILSPDVSTREHCVRWLRKMRARRISEVELRKNAEQFASSINVNADRLLADSRQPGSTVGYPHLAKLIRG